MPTNRIHHRTAVALVSAVGLLFALGVQAGSSAVATDTSDAGTSGSLQGKVRVHLRGHMKGPQFAAFGRGRFTMSGVISDRGSFVDEFQGAHPPGEPHVRTLRGAKGTIQMMVDGGGCGPYCVPVRHGGESPTERRRTPGFGGGEPRKASTGSSGSTRR